MEWTIIYTPLTWKWDSNTPYYFIATLKLRFKFSIPCMINDSPLKNIWNLTLYLNLNYRYLYTVPLERDYFYGSPICLFIYLFIYRMSY